MNNTLSPRIHLHSLIRKGCPLSPYLYVLTTYSLGYLLEAAHQRGQIRWVSLPRGKEIVNNHFPNDSILSMIAEKEYVLIVMECLSLFYKASGAIVNDHKIYYWIISLDDLPAWIPTTWNFVQPGVIVIYLGIPFGVDLSHVSMWE